MSFRTTFILLLTVLLAGGAYWLLIGAPDRDERRVAGLGALQLRPERVQQLILEREEFHITARRVDDEWRIVAPVSARANAGEMDRILSSLRSLPRGAVITPRDLRESGLTRHDYGLERPSAFIEWSDELMRYRLLIGRASPLGDHLYVMFENGEDIFSVPVSLWDIWPESVVTLRDRILFHGDPRRAYRFEVRRPGSLLQVQQFEDGAWRIQQPAPALADSAAVRQWIDRAFEWRIAEFIADSISDPSVYGLDDAAIQVTIWTEGQPTGQSILVGNAIEANSDWVYARRRSGESVFAIPKTIMETATVRSHSLRDRTLVPVLGGRIQHVTIEAGTERVVLAKQAENDWLITAPKQAEADQSRVDELIDRWTTARIDRFVDDPEVFADANVSTNDAFHIIFRIEDTDSSTGRERTTRLTLYQDDGDGGYVWVRRDTEPTIYQVTNELVEAAVSNPLYYRHRQLFDFEPDDVLYVEQAVQDESWQWRREQDTAFPDHEAVLQLLQLHVEAFVEDGPDDWSSYGLDQPQATWTLGLTADAGIGRVLMLGDMLEDGRVFARTRGHELLFLLSADVAEALLTMLRDSGELTLPEESVEIEEL